MRAPQWTVGLAFVWSITALAVGLCLVVVPQYLLAEEGYRTVMRGLAAAFGMLLVTVGIQGFAHARTREPAKLAATHRLFGGWALLLPAVLLTNLGAVEPIRMVYGVNVLMLVGISMLFIGTPAMLAAQVLRRLEHAE